MTLRFGEIGEILEKVRNTRVLMRLPKAYWNNLVLCVTVSRLILLVGSAEIGLIGLFHGRIVAVVA